MHRCGKIGERSEADPNPAIATYGNTRYAALEQLRSPRTGDLPAPPATTPPRPHGPLKLRLAGTGR